MAGTTQVVLSSGTARYMGAAVNPIQAAVGCYEKSFPYLSGMPNNILALDSVNLPLEHTILIALGKFKELFEDIPKQVLNKLPTDMADLHDEVEDFPHYKWTLSQATRWFSNFLIYMLILSKF
jgi:hypothetical protein